MSSVKKNPRFLAKILETGKTDLDMTFDVIEKNLRFLPKILETGKTDLHMTSDEIENYLRFLAKILEKGKTDLDMTSYEIENYQWYLAKILEMGKTDLDMTSDEIENYLWFLANILQTGKTDLDMTYDEIENYLRFLAKIFEMGKTDLDMTSDEIENYLRFLAKTLEMGKTDLDMNSDEIENYLRFLAKIPYGVDKDGGLSKHIVDTGKEGMLFENLSLSSLPKTDLDRPFDVNYIRSHIPNILETGKTDLDMTYDEIENYLRFLAKIPYGVKANDICKDGGLLMYILEKGKKGGPDCQNPHDLDHVLVKYEVRLFDDGTLVSKSHDYGVKFKLKDGHFCPAFSKVVKTLGKRDKAIVIVKPKYGFGEKGRPADDDQASVPPNATLEITLRLLNWKKVPFYKNVLKEGEGYECPNKGAVVKLRLIGKLQDSTVFFTKGHGDDDDDQAQLFEFKTNEKQVIKGLDRAVMTMKKGEVAFLTIGPKYAFGSQPKLDFAPPNSTVYYEVELVSFVKGKEISDMNTKEKMEVARKKIEKAKALYRADEDERASKRFEKALKFIKNDISFRGKQKKYKKYAMDLMDYCTEKIAECREDYKEAQIAFFDRMVQGRAQQNYAVSCEIWENYLRRNKDSDKDRKFSPCI